MLVGRQEEHMPSGLYKSISYQNNNIPKSLVFETSLTWSNPEKWAETESYVHSDGRVLTESRNIYREVVIDNHRVDEVELRCRGYEQWQSL